MSNLGPIKYLTIHCAATPAGRKVPFADIEAWDISKFGQKSYHWIVGLDGALHRSLKDTVKGAHVGGANSGNIGVCYIGGTDALGHPADTRTIEQKRALRTLIRTYQERFPKLIVLGHRNWPGVKKACPSFDVPGWLKAGMPVEEGETVR